jgi:hypothetical protein
MLSHTLYLHTEDGYQGRISASHNEGNHGSVTLYFSQYVDGYWDKVMEIVFFSESDDYARKLTRVIEVLAADRAEELKPKGEFKAAEWPWHGSTE